MQCNKNTMNTRVIRGNQYTQDMMDPRGFIMDQGECNYDNFAVSQPLPPQPPQPPIVQCNCQCNNNNDQTPKCPIPYEPAGTDSTYSSCSTLAPCAGNAQCCIGLQAQPITSANCMPYIIRTYKVSDAIKFDRVATSATPVLAAGALTSPTVTVTGAPLNPGTYRFKVKEVCFGDLNLAINPGAPTLGGVALTQTNVFNTTYTRLVRSPINLPASLQCCKQCLGTTLEYNQPTLSATVSSPTAPTTETIPVLLRGKCGCTNIEVRTTINVQTNISFTFDSLKGALCRRPNLTPVLADQYYQAKLTLGCINATITAPTVAGGAYTISIVDPVYANLVMRLTVSLLSYGTMAVLSTIEPVQARDIPVQTANFDFDSCLQ